MKYTRQQLNDMQEYVVSNLKMMKNHTYPKEERTLNLLLVMVSDQRVETGSYGDKETIKEFEYKCICEWSKDNDFGFIPNTECPVHGKATKKTLSKCVPIRDSPKTSEDKKC